MAITEDELVQDINKWVTHQKSGDKRAQRKFYRLFCLSVHIGDKTKVMYLRITT